MHQSGTRVLGGFFFFPGKFKGSLTINILNDSKYITEDTGAIYPISLTTV